MPVKRTMAIFGAMVSGVCIMATAFAAASDTSPAPPNLPGGSDDVRVTPSELVVGDDRGLTVSGSGFQDCPGSFDLALRIDDTWRSSEPGNVMATGVATIGASGDLESTLVVDGSFDSNWSGYVTMEGGCLGSARRLFGPVTLAFKLADPALAADGIAVPPDAQGAAGFLFPADFIAQTYVPPDQPGATAATQFDHFSAWVDGVRCATVDVADGKVERSGDAVVYVGLPGQPSVCRADAAAVTFTSGWDDAALTNRAAARAGILQSIRPFYDPAASGPTRPSWRASSPSPWQEPSRCCRYAAAANALPADGICLWGRVASTHCHRPARTDRLHYAL